MKHGLHLVVGRMTHSDESCPDSLGDGTKKAVPGSTGGGFKAVTCFDSDGLHIGHTHLELDGVPITQFGQPSLIHCRLSRAQRVIQMSDMQFAGSANALFDIKCRSE
jgi:hypothetical protein